jgi:hypothetical protein
MMLRVALVAGLLPKLLIPVGFMPAAFADGGPVAVCGGYGWPQAPASATIPMATGHVTHAGMSADESGDEHERHHQWERCVFAGAASSTPLAAAWQLDPIPAGTDSIDGSALRPITGLRAFHFRSRAPPTPHS